MLNLLGLVKRANKLTSGTDLVISELRKKNIYLIFLATDASDNTKKKIYDKAKYYHVDVIDIFDSNELNLAIGSKGKMVIGIKDLGFSKKIKEMRDNSGQC